MPLIGQQSHLSLRRVQCGQQLAALLLGLVEPAVQFLLVGDQVGALLLGRVKPLAQIGRLAARVFGQIGRRPLRDAQLD